MSIDMAITPGELTSYTPRDLFSRPGQYRSRPCFRRGRVLCPSHFKGEPMDYIPAWRGDGMVPAVPTRQQFRAEARRRGVVTGRTVAVIAKQRAEAEAHWKGLVARFNEHAPV